MENPFEREGQTFDITQFFNFPDIYNLKTEANDSDKDSLKKIWATSETVGDGLLKISSDAVQISDIVRLKSKGYIYDNGENIELTASGKKMLKEVILSEDSSFTKVATKKLIANNAYDFDDSLLIRIKHAEKVGAKYISVPKKKFANINPQTIDNYNIETRDPEGNSRKISSYNDTELIKVLHLTKRIIKNAAKITEQCGQTVPVNRIKAFSDLIMERLNK